MLKTALPTRYRVVYAFPSVELKGSPGPYDESYKW